MPNPIGIDLGTTNSLIAVLEGDRPRIIPNRAGARMTPSVVALTPSGELLVGAAARRRLANEPDTTVAEVKRLMGSSERVRLGERVYSPTEISAAILRSLALDAEHLLGARVEEAVVTVPAYFTDAQRQATKDAGELAGFRVERILNEPTAAALAYGLDHLDKEQFVLVYDLGGGTLDVSVLEMFEGVLDVKASAGNNRLGGTDFDRALVDLFAAEILGRFGLDIRTDPRAMARLKAAAEEAKVELSSVAVTRVLVPALAVREGQEIALDLELTRGRLEELVEPLIQATLLPVEAALKDAGIDRRAVTEVVLVGGASRMPVIERRVAEYFSRELRRGVHPDEAVALGAAVQAGLKSGAISQERGIMITDVCPFTLGVEVQTSAGSQRVPGIFSPIIPRNSTVPVSKTEIYSTTADGQRQVAISVYQGESRFVKSNTFLDSYTVDGIPPAKAGLEKVAVTFAYDINGILRVTTKVVSTGKEASLLVDESARRMSPREREVAKERLAHEIPAGGVPAPPEDPSPKEPSADGPPRQALDELHGRVERSPGDVTARRVLGEALLAKRSYGVAADELEKALELNPEDADVRLLLSKAYLAEDRLPPAERILRKGVELRPGRADLRDALAGALVSSGRVDDALLELEEAASLDPDDVSRLLLMARLYGSRALPLQAGRCLARARGCGARDPDLRQRVEDAAREMSSETEGELPRRRELVQRLVDIRGGSAGARAETATRLGFLLAPGPAEATGPALSEALLLLEGALTLDPTDEVAALLMGDVLVRMGRTAEGRTAYGRALLIEPSGGAARRLAWLDQSLSDEPAVGRIGALAYSRSGGVVSVVEAVAVAGKGELSLSGNVGAIGREAANVVFSCLKASARRLGIGDLERRDLHLHFVDTEVPKDGPSAGLALALAAASAYLGRPLPKALAASGELTLHGAVRAVGGLHEKLVAAALAGIETALVPVHNHFELKELSPEVKRRVLVVPVASLEEALRHTLAKAAS